MKNLLSNGIVPKNTLYVFGNGFDLAHGLKTAFEDFHNWLISNKFSQFVYLMEKLYPTLLLKGLWSDMETALARVNVDMIYQFDRDYRDGEWGRDRDKCKEDFCRETGSVLRVASGSSIADKLRMWTKSIQIDSVNKKFSLSAESKYLTFNYTKTLEIVYGINDVCHIHGCSDLDKDGKLDIVVGCKSPKLEFDIEGMKEDICSKKQIIANILKENIKYVEGCMLKHYTFFDNLECITDIIVFGHSLADVDKDYFLHIANNVSKKANWYYHVYDIEKLEYIKHFAYSVCKQSHQYKFVSSDIFSKLKKINEVLRYGWI